MEKRSDRKKTNKKPLKQKLATFWFPLIFFLAVFIFMIGFRHEETLSNPDSRSIESVTFQEEWAQYGNIPTLLAENTEELPPEVRSRLIHRLMDEEPVHIMLIPSYDMADLLSIGDIEITGEEGDRLTLLTTVENEEAGEYLPEGLKVLKDRLADVYEVEQAVNISVLHPAEAERIMYETIEEEAERRLEAQEEEAQRAINEGEEVPDFDDTEDEPYSIYRRLASGIRGASPDIILFDFDWTADHLLNSDFFLSEDPDLINQRAAEEQFIAFADTLYRNIDHFSTYVLFDQDIYGKIGLAEGPLQERLEEITSHSSFPFLHFQTVQEYEDPAGPPQDRWAEDNLIPLFCTD